ncbi:hypothetical protein GCM10025865_25440 [Paraoerskovia sediminicola]|uniref:Uncharacterized protein n=1 Tax=Paraoerskovia sediminicola TaxID=1138587 RepID=A0ABM8G585_9CELL|nr:hypothetical protein GCM10025865_25440 [Paraoerskovia sediminicola]
MRGHDVGVPLDDDDAALLGDLPLGEIDPVQDVRLLVERRLGGVEVLGTLVLVVELAGPEADDRARHVTDRPDQPTTEPVVGATLALAHQARRDELGAGEAPALEVPLEVVPAGRCVADPEGLGVGAAEAALGEELAGRPRPGGHELLGEVLLGDAVRLQEALPAPGLLAAARAAPARPGVLVAELDPDRAGEVLDGLREPQPVDLLDERDDVAALAAAEAVPAPHLGPHVERRRALVVEGAQALERPHPRGLERDVRRDDLLDASALTHRVDVVPLDECHGGDSRCRGAAGSAGPDEPGVQRDRAEVGERRDLVDDDAKARAVVRRLLPVLDERGLEGERTAVEDHLDEVPDDRALPLVDRFLLAGAIT